MVKSIILAAGKGTRMKSDKPKVLHEIFGKALVGYVIDAVNYTGFVDENFVIVGHQADIVEEYIKNNYYDMDLNINIYEKAKTAKKETVER